MTAKTKMGQKMLNQLTQGQYEQLKQHLIVPIAVADILHHDLEVEPEMQYGLHLALSEIDPDSALLAIALCASDLADKNINRTPLAAALKKEANNIIDDYGPTWLRYFKNGPMSPDAFEAVLETVPEDLEALADIMDALCSEIEDENCTTALLANLLSIQARAHMEISDYILSEMAFEKSQTQENIETVPQQQANVIDMEAYRGSNILLFPGTSRS